MAARLTLAAVPLGEAKSHLLALVGRVRGARGHGGTSKGPQTINGQVDLGAGALFHDLG
jgi:hypothetical protein